MEEISSSHICDCIKCACWRTLESAAFRLKGTSQGLGAGVTALIPNPEHALVRRRDVVEHRAYDGRDGRRRRPLHSMARDSQHMPIMLLLLQREASEAGEVRERAGRHSRARGLAAGMMPWLGNAFGM